MRPDRPWLALALALAAAPCVTTPATAQERAVVDASEPTDIAVTIYRDPGRMLGGEIDRDNPRGFGMISETRTVTLPPGRSTIRFEGVAEGMVAVSAIVTGLPGGTIEKNRNADLLSPASLVDGTLGNRVTITRTNPATGEAASEDAIVRTRADGGLVLQTAQGYEAVRCSGLPERLTFDSVPGGLSAQPVFTIDTASEAGGTYEVTLSYLSWGFDWEANYVATLDEGRDADDVRFGLTSWLTVLNDNGQTFENAELMAVAGTLNIVSDFDRLSSPPLARPLRLTCWPRGSTAAGSPVVMYGPPPPLPPPMASDGMIVVTGSRVAAPLTMESVSPVAVIAEEEQLGDLKLYRVPVPVDVNAQGLKQIAFLREDDVEGKFFYEAPCEPLDADDRFVPMNVTLETENEEERGLGMALPAGSIAVFEPSSFGDLLVAEDFLRDYPVGRDVDFDLGDSSQVFLSCALRDDHEDIDGGWEKIEAVVTNANPESVRVRLLLGSPGAWNLRGVRQTLKDGERVLEFTVRGNSSRSLRWEAQEIE
ncbi:DUF4139 domain-containing protein [Aurantiacibacter aquimixticola]|uniref:DUF4139 domain-containing protein n=1 Tax=Aurantiacibacter aquimixticola TaxID=1958945 RepID=UPI001058BAC8|nr:hypothetical protein [Aurantiacibacter aquimixticola]